ncbi:MAG: hypothetical protein U0694_20650 [Anaerolineae bacterium]
MLDWDAHHEQIDQDGTLREAFERNLTAQIERFFGSPMTQDQVTERIRQAEEAGNAEEAADLRRRLAHANQFAVVETLRVEEISRSATCLLANAARPAAAPTAISTPTMW